MGIQINIRILIYRKYCYMCFIFISFSSIIHSTIDTSFQVHMEPNTSLLSDSNDYLMVRNEKNYDNASIIQDLNEKFDKSQKNYDKVQKDHNLFLNSRDNESPAPEKHHIKTKRFELKNIVEIMSKEIQKKLEKESMKENERKQKSKTASYYLRMKRNLNVISMIKNSSNNIDIENHSSSTFNEDVM